MKITLLDESNKKDNDYIGECELTQLAILSGCAYDLMLENEEMFLSGDYFLKSFDLTGKVHIYASRDGLLDVECDNPSVGIRPVLEDIGNFDEITRSKKLNDNQEFEVEFGYYPTCLPKDSRTISELNGARGEKKLKIVGRNSFSNIYEYNGVMYSLITSNDRYLLKDRQGAEHTINYNQEVWLELTPVVWLVDEENRRLVSKKVLLAGYNFDDTKAYYDGIFKKTSLYEYLNEVMLKDLTMMMNKKVRVSDLYKLRFDKNDEYGFIRDLILSGVFVGLVGNADEEKEEILSSIDPEFTSLDYFEQIGIIDVDAFKEKCKNEPNKMHIINVTKFDGNLEDEITTENSLRIFDKKMGNVRNYCITYTFNTIFDRLDRFIPIEVKSRVSKIYRDLISEETHPLIYSLILYLGEEKIKKVRIENLKKASSVLKNNGNVYAIRYILGDELTDILTSLADQEILSLDDVINRAYYENTFKLSREELSLLIPFLAQVSEDNIEVVRNFIIMLGDEALLNTFDFLWVSNDETRKKIIDGYNRTNNMVRSRKWGNK